ncbi:MAG: SMP-30/gluconolactonase/LRE family protein [Planctomycetota bacterium]
MALFYRLGAAAWTLAFAVVLTAFGGEVKFAGPPSAAADGNNVKIAFALTAPADVAVGVADANGVVVRHLGAGLLGPKAPKPFKPDSLAQTIVWDRTDDCGKPAPPGKYTVEVRAGILPAFDRVIGYEPKALSDVQGLAVGSGGELFVLSSGGQWVEQWKPAIEVAVFSRDMKYRRTILPWPGDLPLEKVPGALPVNLPDGSYVPRVFHGPGRMAYLGLHGRPGRQGLALTPGGELLLTCPSSRVVRIGAADGAVPEPFEVARFSANGYDPWSPIALSPDGKWVYTACSFTCEKKPVHAVYRVSLAAPGGKAEPFVGEPGTPGGDEKHLNEPGGVATDAQGNVYVADHGNDRIAVFSPEGKPLAAIKVEGPVSVAVDGKRGTLYVLTLPQEDPLRNSRHLWEIKRLIKIKSLKEPQIVGTHNLPRGYSYPVLAIDSGADKPVLWIGNYAGWGLWRMVDAEPGGALPDKAEMVAAGSQFPESLSGVEHLAVDPATERLYAAEYYTAYGAACWKAFDGRTGKALPLGKMNAADLAVGYDGCLYGYRGGGGAASVFKWDSSGNPVSFSGTGKNESEKLPRDVGPGDDTDREGVKGLDVAPDGSIYVMHFRGASRKGENARVCVVGPDGKVSKPEFIYHLTPKASSPRLDPQGNLYLLDTVLPEGAPPGPPEFAGAMATDKAWDCYTGRFFGLRGIFGSVVKFPPAGGGVYGAEKPAGKAAPTTCQDGKVVEGAVWIKPHAAPVYGDANHWCFCFAARMGMDRYGRIYVPQAPLRRVEVWDSEGNRLAVFGRYGNADNGGKDSIRPVTGVPLNWPGNVAASDSAVYVGDTNNRRVVRVRLDYEAMASCPVP